MGKKEGPDDLFYSDASNESRGNELRLGGLAKTYPNALIDLRCNIKNRYNLGDWLGERTARATLTFAFRTNSKQSVASLPFFQVDSNSSLLPGCHPISWVTLSYGDRLLQTGRVVQISQAGRGPGGLAGRTGIFKV